MRIPGQRIKRTRLIQTEKYVVAVEVEMVIPVDDPSEPCYESETVQLLREIKEHAERGDVAWLPRRAKFTPPWRLREQQGGAGNKGLNLTGAAIRFCAACKASQAAPGGELAR